jgi:trk system potassium uptake protein TrkH
VVRDTFTHGGERRLADFILDVVRFTLILEGAGALILFARFLLQYPLAQALYLAVFHAVSAFCNAGFSPFSQSLLPYQGDWVINLTIGALILCGGIGFLVMTEIKRSLHLGRRMWSRLSLHSKLVLSTSGILLLLGALLILLMEWRNTLSELPLSSRLLAALFQSVTARTAGFNTLPMGELANETLFVLILLMFIGASSGSCGGGVKTGTLAVLVTLSLSKIRGHERPHAFGRTLTQESVGRAVGLILVSFAIVVFATFALLASELGGVSHARTQGRFLSLLFEVVSAFGTVGLSMGETSNLSPLGRLIITGVMFVGRLGPLAVGVALSRRRILRYHYAEEGIMIG